MRLLVPPDENISRLKMWRRMGMDAAMMVMAGSHVPMMNMLTFVAVGKSIINIAFLGFGGRNLHLQMSGSEIA